MSFIDSDEDNSFLEIPKQTIQNQIHQQQQQQQQQQQPRTNTISKQKKKKEESSDSEIDEEENEDEGDLDDIHFKWRKGDIIDKVKKTKIRKTKSVTYYFSKY